LKEWIANDGTLNKKVKAKLEKAKARKGKGKQVIESDEDKMEGSSKVTKSHKRK
jgi:hypothetical protein